MHTNIASIGRCYHFPNGNPDSAVLRIKVVLPDFDDFNKPAVSYWSYFWSNFF